MLLEGIGCINMNLLWIPQRFKPTKHITVCENRDDYTHSMNIYDGPYVDDRTKIQDTSSIMNILVGLVCLAMLGLFFILVMLNAPMPIVN
jgi:hypothetical protein